MESTMVELAYMAKASAMDRRVGGWDGWERASCERMRLLKALVFPEAESRFMNTAHSAASYYERD